MARVKRLSLDAIALGFVLLVAAFGVFGPAEQALKGLRFELGSRGVSGDIVFLAIDPLSLDYVGVWPWPRSVHGTVVDALIDNDVADIFVDIDFSSASRDVEDAAFAAALERAGGFVALAAFVQQKSVTSPELSLNKPIERFARHAEVAVVNVFADRDGDVRSYPFGAELGSDLYPSAASFLGKYPAEIGEFNIDFSIDARAIDQISIADLLTGQVAPSRLENKQVVIGASALELRDTLTVPRFGNLPGPLLQILAAETLKQQRMLSDYGWQSGLLASVVLFGLILLLRRRIGLGLALGGGLAFCLGVEVVAIVAQVQAGILVDTIVCHASLAVLALVGSAQELDFRTLMLKRTTRDRDVTQSILNRVIADNFDGVIVVDISGSILAASTFAGEFLGFDADTATAHPMRELLPMALVDQLRLMLDSKDREAVKPQISELQLDVAAGEARTIEFVITLSDPTSLMVEESPSKSVVACLTFRDVTERKAHDERLTYIAQHDVLTGALSRQRITEIAESLAAREAPKGSAVNLFMIDLARFKAVNDILGHDYGDELLKQVRFRLHDCGVDAVARMGGDSFAVLKTGMMLRSDLDAFAVGLLDTISKVYLLGEHRALIGAKIGVSTSIISGLDAEVLIAHADMALSSAKSSQISGYAIYSPEMSSKLTESREMEIALSAALKQEQIYVTYQPQVEIKTGRFIGAEALVRWQHPVLGEVRPDKFVSLAEETGFILELGRWVMNESCREAADWPDDVHVSVNISPMQFEFGDVFQDVKNALEVSGLPAERLEVEITEGVLIADSDRVIRVLSQLKELGIGVALDDFGTGYSSLSYLDKLPIDKIKIDQAFVRGLPGSIHSAAVVSAVTTMSQSLGKLVVAEGIEEDKQAHVLALAGCHIGQGYLYGKPMQGSEIRSQFFPDSRAVAQQLG